jgi:hypothetical protein
MTPQPRGQSDSDRPTTTRRQLRSRCHCCRFAVASGIPERRRDSWAGPNIGLGMSERPGSLNQGLAFVSCERSEGACDDLHGRRFRSLRPGDRGDARRGGDCRGARPSRRTHALDQSRDRPGISKTAMYRPRPSPGLNASARAISRSCSRRKGRPCRNSFWASVWRGCIAC